MTKQVKRTVVATRRIAVDPREAIRKGIEAMLGDHDMGVGGVAWCFDCRPTTVAKWVAGLTLPGRDNMLKLLIFKPELLKHFEELAKVPQTRARRPKVSQWRELKLQEQAA